MRRSTHLPALAMTLCLLLVLLRANAQPPADGYLRVDRLGIAHISVTGAPAGSAEGRYTRALTLGAGWNRWPLYWDRVQAAPDTWDWSAYDAQVAADLRHGLRINAVLLGRPAFAAQGASIAGLDEPVFADGSDRPGPGKALNPANPWAVFAYAAALRYRPGGELDALVDLPHGAGVRVWEIWNEPDFAPFWQGGVADYARMLKVASLAIKHADPAAQIVFGGLLYPDDDVNWLAQVLDIYAGDPLAASYGAFFDVAAIHAYANPWRAGWLTLVARETLEAFGWSKPVWVTETGVPVWDDYPGPTWDATSLRYASQQQQAWYIVQAAAYAWWEGAEVVFYHQLYDDCGDQPPGTDFPPHSGDLCLGGALCYGDAFGLFRNLPGADCFGQHPQPGTARPAARAYSLLAAMFGGEAFRAVRRGPLMPQVDAEEAVVLAFERPSTGERLTVFWNRTFRPVTLRLPAAGTNGQLASLVGQALITPEPDGAYAITLPPAQPDNYPTPPRGHDAAIGGPPYVLLERSGTEVTPVTLDLDAADLPASLPTPLPPTAVIPPTVDPAFDTTPPTASVNPLPPTSPAQFTVAWQGRDDSGIAAYVVWVRVDGGAWQPWLETTTTEAAFTGEPGRVYEFGVWAVDLAGNWTPGTTVQPQAVTQVTG